MLAEPVRNKFIIIIIIIVIFFNDKLTSATHYNTKYRSNNVELMKTRVWNQ